MPNVNPADVGGICVINLASRPERWEAFQGEADRWEKAFGQVPQRFAAVAGTSLPGFDEKPWFTGRISGKRKRSWAGKGGCILSHRAVIALAAQRQWESVLILEDDALLAEEMVQLWRDGLRALVESLPEDWSAVNFCTTIPITPCRVVGEYRGIRLVEAAGAFGAVAYLLNGRVLAGLLAELPDEGTIWSWVARHKTIDRWFSQNLVRFGRVYLLAPSLVGHRTGSSDTSMTQENDWLLDFSLQDLRCVGSNWSFVLGMGLRRAGNALRARLSMVRFLFKRLRGF